MTRSTFSQQYQDAMARFSRKPVSPAEPTPAMPEAAIPAEAMPPVPPPTGFKDATTNVPDTWRRFSDVFGFAPPSGNDRKGPTFDAGEWPETLRPFIPAKKHGYYMPEEATEALWNAHIDGDVVWLHGLSGTGKSSLEEQFCAHIGQPFLRFNGREDVESGALFGQLVVGEGDNAGTEWRDGLLTEGVRYGARVLLDEATLIPSGIMMGLQWLLERDGKLMLTDKPAAAGDRLVEPDPRFRLTFADNSKGQGDTMGLFNGVGVMNTATLNRVGLTLEIEYLPAEKEIQVLEAQFGDRYHTDVLKNVTQLAALLRRGLQQEQLTLAFSLRSIENVLTKAYNYRTMGLGPALRRAFDEGYANLLPEDEEHQAAHQFFDMVF